MIGNMSTLTKEKPQVLPISRIIRMILTTKMLGQFHDKWSSLAMTLEMASDKIKRIRDDLRLDKITLMDALHEIIEEWYARCGSAATLEKLIDAFEVLEINAFGEMLRLEFNLPCKGSENPYLSWDEIGSQFQQKVESNLTKLYASVEFDDDSKKMMTRDDLVDLMIGKEPSPFKNCIPEALTYYVARTLLTRDRLTEKLFECSSSDIFLFTGIPRHSLSYISGAQRTDTTSNQLDNRDPNVKYMVLDFSSHFTQFSSSSAVHHIKFEEDKFYWVKTVGSLDNLRNSIDTCQNNSSESEFLKMICSPSVSNVPVFISDSPGMGKSEILKQIARNIATLLPGRIIIFQEFPKFIDVVKRLNKLNPTSLLGDISNDNLNIAIHNSLGELSCKNALGSRILHSKLNSDTITTELLLDGYDELSSESATTAQAIIKEIHSSVKSIRLWVTTRPHLLESLEDTVTVLGYNIQPFTIDDQINFLASYWSRNQHLPVDRLRQYASNCLNQLKSTLSEKDVDIAGIPLQCLMIGEVYEEEATDYSRSDENFSGTKIRVTSITHLYQLTIEKKLNKYQSTYSKQKLSYNELINMHIQLALKLISTSYFEAVKSKFIPVKMDDVLNVGILESKGSDGELVFIHRTFAEYLVSLFIVNMLNAEHVRSGFIYDKDHSAKWNLEGLLLSIVGLDLKNSFHTPGICFFTNSLLSGKEIQEINSKINGLILGGKWKQKNFARACVNSDFVNIFNLFDSVNVFLQYEKEIFTQEFLLTAIEKSSVDFIRNIIDRFERYSKFHSDLQTEALRVAAKRGEFTPIEFLLIENNLQTIMKDDDNWMRMQILHCCVEYSEEDSEEIIRQKIEVIQFLVKMNHLLLMEKDDKGNIPLLCKNVNMRLLIKLIELGSNVATKNYANETILHVMCYLSPEEYHHVLTIIDVDNLANFVSVQDDSFETPLLRLIKTMDPEEKTLAVFKNAGADFNICDKYWSCPLLAIAIMEGRNGSTIKQLILSESAATWRGKGDYTLLHLASKYSNLNAIPALVEHNLDINSVDDNLETPLHIAAKPHGHVDRLKIIKAVIECGGSATVVNKAGNTFLHELLYNSDNIASEVFHDVIELLINVKCVNILEVENLAGKSCLVIALAEIDLEERTISLLYKHGVNLIKFATWESGESNAHNLTTHTNCMKLKVLIDNGPGAYTTTNSDTFLHVLLRKFVTMSGNQFHEIAEFLVRKDHAKLFNIHGKDGVTPLHLAVQIEHAKDKTFSFLFASGVKFDCADADGDSVLMYAIRANKNTDFLYKLIGYGANIKQTNSKGQNLLHVAINFSYFDVLQSIINIGMADVNGVDQDGNTPLHVFLQSDWASDMHFCLQGARLLLRSGASAYTTNKRNLSPFSIARTKFPDFKYLLQLLSAGWDTELHTAVSRNEFARVEEHLEIAAGVNAQSKKLEPSLQSKSSSDDRNDPLKIIKLLVDSNADPFMKDRSICTSLHILLGGNTNLTPADFHDLVAYLIEKEHIKSLQTSGRNYGIAPIHLALFNIDVEERTVILLSSHVNWNLVDNLDRTPLFFASCRKSNSSLLPQLVELGADCKILDNFENTLLHVAVEYGNVDALKYFISLGLSVNAANSQGNTPLHFAFLLGQENVSEVIGCLDEAGADTSLANYLGETPALLLLAHKNRSHNELKIGSRQTIKIIMLPWFIFNGKPPPFRLNHIF